MADTRTLQEHVAIVLDAYTLMLKADPEMPPEVAATLAAAAATTKALEYIEVEVHRVYETIPESF